MSKTVIVSEDGNRFTVTVTHIDERTGERCERCGIELWTRDGDGPYHLAMMVEGSPVLMTHGPISCPRWFNW